MELSDSKQVIVERHNKAVFLDGDRIIKVFKAEKPASDIFNDGIVFTGGAAALTGLCEAVYAVMKIPCGVADDPQTCVVMGCGRALEDYSALRHLLGNGRGR